MPQWLAGGRSVSRLVGLIVGLSLAGQGCASTAGMTGHETGELSPKWQAVAAFGRGVRARWEGRFPAARVELERAVSLDPQSARVRRELGRVLLLSEDLPGATEVLESAVSLNPTSVRGLEDLSEAYRRQRRHDDAIGLLQRVRELAPDRIHTVYLLHALLLVTNRTEDGRRMFQELAEGRYSHMPFAHEGLGDFLFRGGMPSEAEACYRHAIALGGLTRGLERKLRLAQERALAATDASTPPTTDPGLRVAAPPSPAGDTR